MALVAIVTLVTWLVTLVALPTKCACTSSCAGVTLGSILTCTVVTAVRSPLVRWTNYEESRNMSHNTVKSHTIPKTYQKESANMSHNTVIMSHTTPKNYQKESRNQS